LGGRLKRRSIKGLRKAAWCEKPRFASTIGKTKGSRRRGLTYERRVTQELTELYGDVAEVFCNRWIEFEDERGPGLASPDCVIIPKDRSKPIVIVEVKLSWKAGVRSKLALIYGRLLKEIYPDREQRHVQVCRALRRDCKEEACLEIDNLLEQTETYRLCHWF
jgi:hypothetical protein